MTYCCTPLLYGRRYEIQWETVTQAELHTWTGRAAARTAGH